jgi:alginate O-acetyltransferase complex protein AlgI
VNGYTAHNPVALLVIGIGLVGTLLAGLALSRLPPGRYTRLLAWLMTVSVTVGVERVCRNEPAGVRMLAIIGALLYAMKAVVSVEARADNMPVLSAWRWLGFAALWPGMRPAPFAHAGRGRQPGAWALVGRGCLFGFFGLILAFLALFIWHQGRPPLSDVAACVLTTVLLLPGLSLMLHFGIFNILAGLWRLAGVDARPLFRAPLAAGSLENFWSRRWNLAFSEMTALGIYRPLSGSLSRKAATVVAFLASGLLHELAISVPVRAGFGLPLLYFLLHGALVLAERSLERAGWAVRGWGWGAHVWVLSWLALPMPILFHRPFLRGVVWPLIGLE